MHSVVVGFLHRKSDKRVFNTVKLLSKLGDVDYLYWSDRPDEPMVMDGVNFIPFYHKLWSNPLKMWMDRRAYETGIMKYLSSVEADLFYLHHFATTKPLAAYKTLSKRKALVITDFHEYVPEQYLEGVAIPRSVKTKYANLLYKKMIQQTHGAVFVSRAMLQMASSVNSFVKSIFVPNYALSSKPPKLKTERRKEVVFVGKTSRKMTREIELVKLLIDSGFSFTSLGSESGFGSLEMKVMEALPYDQMMDYISQSAFTIISYDVSDKNGKPWMNMVYSMPNKLFDSLSSGTPVIVASDFVEMSETIQRDNTGVIIDRRDTKGSVEKIVSIFSSSQYDKLIDSIRTNQDHYFWNSEKQEYFLSYVENIVSTKETR